MSGERKAKGRRALGKGLGALIPGADKGTAGRGRREFFLCPVDRIRPADQPRKRFDEQALSGLVDSIREQGVIQPLVVRRLDDGYELIAGERRWRAAQLAGIVDVPVVIKDVSALEAFEMALVENIQREDLNPIEEAEAFQRLVDEHGYSQTKLATRIGRDRSTISNSLRLLGLPAEIKQLVLDEELTEGHARALLQAGAAKTMMALARAVTSQGLSVRETERRARAASSKVKPGGKAKPDKPSAQVRSLQERLQRALGARVRLTDRGGKGKIEITYTSYDELEGILDRILK